MKHPKPKDFKPEPVFPDDHKVERWRGKPRCQAWNNNHGRQCGKPALSGKRVCERCGGKSLSGVASPTFKDGSHSKRVYRTKIPKKLTDHFGDAESRELTTINEAELLRTFIMAHLEAMNQGDSHPVWVELRKGFQKIRNAIQTGNDDLFSNTIDYLEKITEPNYRAAMAESKVVSYAERYSKMVEREQKIHKSREEMMSVNEVLAMMTYVILAVREAILLHADDRIAKLILNDSQAAYDKWAASLFPDSETI